MNIIVDIDGTLADMRHRRHFVVDGNHDWKSFNESMVMDTPIIPIVTLVTSIASEMEHLIVLVTGRSEEYREHTEEWLQDHYVPYWKLFMRQMNDSRPDHVIKEEILRHLIETHRFKPDLVIDDRQDVVDMWRRNGIITLQNSMKELP